VREAPASGNMSTLAGTSLGAGFSGDGTLATNAQVNAPTGLVLDGAANLYIADTVNNRIRIICNSLPGPFCPAGSTSGTMFTFAGGRDSDTGEYAGDGGPAVRAGLNSPQGLAMDASGNLYIADTENHCIRIVQGGFISTFAGTCASYGFSGDNGPAIRAQLFHPEDVAVDAAGNVYIADTFNSRIRMVTPDGIIHTIAGTGRNGYSGDGGLASSARLNFPQSVAVGPNGTLYVADTQNNVIRLLGPLGSNNGQPVAAPPLISSVLSSVNCGGYSGLAAPGSWIAIQGTNLASDTRQWTSSDFQGNIAPTSLDGTQVSVAGQSAVVMSISPTLVNAQVPLAVSPGQQSITVTAASGTSIPFVVTINAVQPGFCQGYTVAGQPYLGATIGSTYILPASANIAGITHRPAHPGEVITFFGNGFGPVTPSPNQGELVQQPNQLTTAPFQVYFGPTQATVVDAGLAQGYIGMYQFDVVVPDIPDSDLVPVTFDLGQFAGAPTLYTAVSQQDPAIVSREAHHGKSFSPAR